MTNASLKQPARATKRTVLVVDDEPGIAQMMVDAAEDFGFEAHAVHDWRSAEAEAADADVILLDLMMPGIDGVTALRALAAARVKSRIVLVSGLDRRVIDSARRQRPPRAPVPPDRHSYREGRRSGNPDRTGPRTYRSKKK